MSKEKTLSTDRDAFDRFDHAVTGEYRTLLRAQVPEGKVWTIPEDRELAVAIPQVDSDTVPDAGSTTVDPDPDGIRVPWMDDPIDDDAFTNDAYFVVRDVDNDETITDDETDVSTSLEVTATTNTAEFVDDVTVTDQGNSGGVDVEVWTIIRAGKIRLSRRTSGDGRSYSEVQNESTVALGLSDPYDPDFKITYANQSGEYAGVYPAGYKFDLDYFGDNEVEVQEAANSPQNSDPFPLIVDLPIEAQDLDAFLRSHPEAETDWSIDDLRREVARSMQ